MVLVDVGAGEGRIETRRLFVNRRVGGARHCLGCGSGRFSNRGGDRVERRFFVRRWRIDEGLHRQRGVRVDGQGGGDGGGFAGLHIAEAGFDFGGFLDGRVTKAGEGLRRFDGRVFLQGTGENAGVVEMRGNRLGVGLRGVA